MVPMIFHDHPWCMPEPAEYKSALDFETISARLRDFFFSLSGDISGAIEDTASRVLLGKPLPPDKDPIKKLQGNEEVEVLQALLAMTRACREVKKAPSKQEELTHLEEAMSRANTAIRTLVKHDQPTYVVRQVQRTLQSHYVALHAGNIPSLHY